MMPGDVRTGALYEAQRSAIREQLAATADTRRVRLGADLVLVFETAATVRTALEEVLRAQRVADADRLTAEIEAFNALLPGAGELVATLYVDVPDPAALADRLAELAGIGEAVALEVSGQRVAARADAELEAAGALRLLFPLDEAARTHIREGGSVAAVVEHAHCRESAALTVDQVRALAAVLGG